MKARERYVLSDHWGFKVNTIVYSVGGAAHFVETRDNENGGLVAKKKFQGKDARERAIRHAALIAKTDDTNRVEAETCFYCGDPAVTSIGFDPRCERHRDV